MLDTPQPETRRRSPRPVLAGTRPDTKGRRRFVVSVALDNFGAGLFLPLAFYYFTVSTSLSVQAIGLAITSGTLVGLLAAPAAGWLTDRYGARAMVVASNLVTAVGYLCYPLASTAAQVAGVVAVVMVADRLYFAARPTLVAAFAGAGALDAWFALVQAVQAGGVGLGALLGGALLAGGDARSLDLVVWLNALTSVAAAVLTAAVRVPVPPAVPAVATARPRWGGFLGLLRVRWFRRLLLGQLLISAAWTVPAAFLPLYMVRTLGLPAWQPMFVFSVNYLLMFAVQTSFTHAARRARRTRAIGLGGLLFLVSLAVFAGAAPFAGWVATGLILAAIVPYTAGETLCTPASNALLAASTPAAVRGRYMSAFQLTGAVAFGLGPGLVGVLFTSGPLLVLAAVGACVAAGAGIFLSCESRLRPEALWPAGAGRPARAAAVGAGA